MDVNKRNICFHINSCVIFVFSPLISYNWLLELVSRGFLNGRGQVRFKRFGVTCMQFGDEMERQHDIDVQIRSLILSNRDN